MPRDRAAGTGLTPPTRRCTHPLAADTGARSPRPTARRHQETGRSPAPPGRPPGQGAHSTARPGQRETRPPDAADSAHPSLSGRATRPRPSACRHRKPAAAARRPPAGGAANGAPGRAPRAPALALPAPEPGPHGPLQHPPGRRRHAHLADPKHPRKRPNDPPRRSPTRPESPRQPGSNPPHPGNTSAPAKPQPDPVSRADAPAPPQGARLRRTNTSPRASRAHPVLSVRPQAPRGLQPMGKAKGKTSNSRST